MYSKADDELLPKTDLVHAMNLVSFFATLDPSHYAPRSLQWGLKNANPFHRYLNCKQKISANYDFFEGALLAIAIKEREDVRVSRATPVYLSSEDLNQSSQCDSRGPQLYPFRYADL
jgi:hypothetical protein